MLRLGFAVALCVAGCDSLLGLGDFTDQEEAVAATASSNGSGAAMASSTASSGGSFGGSGGSAVEGGGGHGGMPTAEKTVFVTGASFFPSDIDDVGVANALCQNVANNAGLAGTYRAWLSDDATTAAANVTGPGPWYRVDGAHVFATAADLLAMNSAPINPILVTELNYTLGTSDRVWTGTLKGGDRGKTCTSGNDDWVTDGMSFGTSGVLGSPDDWTNVAEESCDSPYHLYCFEL